MSSSSPLIGPTDADVMLLRLDDRLRVMEQTSVVAVGVVAYVPNGQPSTPVWNAMSYTTGYSDWGAPYPPGSYMKDPSGIVHLRGLVKFSPPGSYGAGVNGVTLPVGFRPVYQHLYIVAASSTNDFLQRIDIPPTGVITRSPVGGGNWDGAYLSYEGVAFDTGIPLLVTSAGAVIPDGWLFADGTTFNTTRYGQLYARLKTTTLPDLRASAPAGTVPIIRF